jgi:hypothetical protein
VTADAKNKTPAVKLKITIKEHANLEQGNKMRIHIKPDITNNEQTFNNNHKQKPCVTNTNLDKIQNGAIMELQH